MKILMNQFMNNEVKFEETLQEDEKWKYDEIEKDEEKMNAFKEWYIAKRAEEYGINPEDIIIHKLVKGSIAVVWSTANPLPVLQAN